MVSVFQPSLVEILLSRPIELAPLLEDGRNARPVRLPS